MFLTCSSFLSSFNLTVLIRIFLKQKSKSSTNLNHKEGKQEETTIDEKYLGCHLPLGLFSCGQFSQDCPRDNYLGNKSSKRKFYLGAIFRVILSGENYLCGNFLGAIIRGQSFRGKLSGGILFRSSYPWGQLSEGGTMI